MSVQPVKSIRLIRSYITAPDSNDRLGERPILYKGKNDGERCASVFVAPEVRFQTIEGIGGAFTEAAAVTLGKLGRENQRRVLEAYFDADQGHGYSLCRTHIQSCDFALGNYAYVQDGDLKLESFSIERDRRLLLPMIRSAYELANESFRLFASPWSPPAWMKTNGKMNEGGRLRPECRQAWAECYVRFIRAYEAEGIPIWGITVQNEPAAIQRWDSCEYSGEEERDFVRDHLGPALERAGLGHVKLMIWDHNRDVLVERAHAVYSDPAASKYVWGTAYHWYGDHCFENLGLHHDAWPDKHLLFSEGCQEGGPHLGEWELGERYAHSMIHDFNGWATGWTDWNLLLDETGGPNHVGNLCSAPIIADTRRDELVFQSSYYYIGHFARFVRPGAKRILCSSSRDQLEVTAFANPNGAVSVVLLNRTERQQPFNLNISGLERSGVLPARSIATCVFGVMEG